MNNFNWDTAFSVDFDLQSGLSSTAETTRRRLSQMETIFCDTEAAVRMVQEEGDPLVYEFHELGCPERAGDLAFGTTVLYPGRVGDEFFCTKGHFHTVLDTAEVYYTLSGEGVMVMENPEGDCIEVPMTKGAAVYVPRRYAHRTVNTGKEPLVFFYTFAADAGHDYGTIETKGYHHLIVADGDGWKVTDNPHWKEG